MQSVDWMVALAVLATSFGVAYGALWLFSETMDRRRKTARRLVREEAEATVFLFDGSMLVDATDPAHRLMATGPGIGTDWARFLTLLSNAFPNLNADLADLSETGQMTLESEDPARPAELRAESWEGLTRIELIELSDDQNIAVDRYSLSAMEEELATLRATADHAPFLVWQEARNGAITWANRTYLNMVRSSGREADLQRWPPARLFDVELLSGPTVDGQPRRLSLRLDREGHEDIRWYDAHSSTVGDELLHFLVPADAIVKAEQVRKDFVQTLTKTFAHLPIGLALFDKDRRLNLFNPALTDLTTLPAEFLSARPTLVAFLDRLRDKQMMPEPKDYKTWRQHLAELEAAATDGTYEESWALPSGQTYRVSGRPHPDGAIAFLFADITAEISLTRRFRSELEVGQSVVDALDEAIAVFAPSGALTMSNRAFAQLWGVDPGSVLGEFGIIDASRVWQDATEPNPIWGDLRDFVTGYADRAEWLGEAWLKDGRHLHCRATPLTGGASLIGFVVDRSFPEPRIDAAEPIPESA